MTSQQMSGDEASGVHLIIVTKSYENRQGGANPPVAEVSPQWSSPGPPAGARPETPGG